MLLEGALRDAGCGMRDAGCGMRDAGCGMRDAGCGMRDAGCGTREEHFPLIRRSRGSRMQDTPAANAAAARRGPPLDRDARCGMRDAGRDHFPLQKGAVACEECKLYLP